MLNQSLLVKKDVFSDVHFTFGKYFSRSLLPAFIFLACNFSFAQDENTDDTPVAPRKLKGFHGGLFVGTYFANKYNAALYDGYGFDWNGNKNDWTHAWLNIKINQQYGAGGAFAGQPDQIAAALGVQHGDWHFYESDMPLPGSLKYNIAFLVGFQGRYCFDKQNNIILGLNGAKLSVNGNFQIELQPVSAQTGMPGAINYRTFSIVGGEQRMQIQLGYQRVTGDDDRLNFLWEAGPIVTFVKFEKNVAQVNSLTIPLTTFYNPYGYFSYNARNLTGIGMGAFAGIGMQISINPKWTIQFVYDASYERIPLGQYNSLKLQNMGGVRAYYNF